MTVPTRRTMVILLGAAAFIVASFRPTTQPESPTTEALPELERIYAPFDTLETDLNEYQWPLPDGFLTTSVFGDFRSTHFHGGIDISTQGREGIPVRAMRSGWVSFVRHGPNGYGNVAELTHADGFSTWHAHLSAFAPKLDSLIRPKLRRSGSVSAEAHPDSGEIRIEAGEIIAYTGSTGAGGPHHHFEIRDAHRNPVDPTLVPAFREHVSDHVAPTFDELAIVPLKSGTLVQGQLRPVYLRPTKRTGAWTIAQRVSITGDVGLTVRVRDAVGQRRFTNRNVELELLVDGVSVLTSRASRLPADDSKQVALHYDWNAKAAGHPFHQKLFIEEGNRLPFYARAPYGSGILRSAEFADGPHVVEVLARDLNGNESRLRADVVFNHPPSVTAGWTGSRLVVAPSNAVAIERLLISTSDDGIRVTPWRSLRSDATPFVEGRWTVEAPTNAPFVVVSAVNRFGTVSDPVWVASRPARSGELRVSTEIVRDMAIVTVRSNAAFRSAPRIRILAEGDVPEPAVIARSARMYEAGFGLRPELGRSITVEAFVEGPDGIVARGTEDIAFAPITPGLGGIAELSDGSFHLHFGPGGVLSDTYVQLERTHDGVRAEPADRLLDEGASVEMDVPAEITGRKAGLFVFNDGDEQLLSWRRAFGEQRLRGRVTRFLGTFRILEDEHPPRFDRAYLAYRSGTLMLELRIRDDRSGLSTSSIRVKVDGDPVPGSFDSDRRRLVVKERLSLSKGRHRVEVRASDRMENENVWVGTVTVR